MRGTITVDAGAAERVLEAGSSLLPVGVVAVAGDFHRGEMVACVTEKGRRIACGLSNYDAKEAQRIAGVKSSNIAAVLGYMNEEELIHRDNLVLLLGKHKKTGCCRFFYADEQAIYAALIALILLFKRLL